jgi:hypothetical protein
MRQLPNRRALVAQEGKAYRKVHSILLADGAFEPPRLTILNPV